MVVMFLNDLDRIEIIRNLIQTPATEEYNLLDPDDEYLHLIGVIVSIPKESESIGQHDKIIFVGVDGITREYEMPALWYRAGTALIFFSEMTHKWRVVPFINHKGCLYTEKFTVPALKDIQTGTL
jgi:hypothetical protein